MIRTLLFFFITCISVAVFAQPPAGDANVGDYYGKKIKAKGAMDVAVLPAKLRPDAPIKVKVKGTVLDACAEKGCWMVMKIDDTNTVRVRMQDYAFFVPIAIIGKTVVAEGEAEMSVLSVKEQKHFAEDAKKSQEEIDAITMPKKEISLMASGILVVE
ncbi:MAG: DUF4920 domain-containing protein [Saprospiraceae bacterium]|jgi:hypothetical protein|nr:DUF4920 domain-containing protein [Candidatus Parvibacillus calidus]MBX2936867.1 DUF4920 domain-containing protein [Saprospiraceae bacterium]MBX7179501.1 DUF4920 domain-containing protein [Saprospiraceae bacterium]MCB0590433.1 DUF4920 domain-containing protein [Saprospiraceae bacterium]MCO5282648.1 DUF4920 domain-containing protein [Saprospiraceae bacterium]